MTQPAVGYLSVLFPSVQRKSYECAAWSETVEVKPGRYPVVLARGGYWFVATAEATILEDYFQPLFAGNAIGKAYDRTQNAGKATTFGFQWDAYTLADQVRLGAVELAEGWELFETGSSYSPSSIHPDGAPIVKVRRIAEGEALEAKVGRRNLWRVELYHAPGVPLWIERLEAREFLQWRATFPGYGGAASTLAGAIWDASARWATGGRPLEYRLAGGPEAGVLTEGEVLALAQPWERSVLVEFFQALGKRDERRLEVLEDVVG